MTVPSKYEFMRTPHSSANYCLYIFERLIQTFKKRNKYINGQELWLKGEKILVDA